MPLHIVRNDITRMAVDVIVNPTNEKLRPDGGVDAAVHKAAGEELSAACKGIGMLQPGHVVLTKGYNLPCKYIIHTVGPRWYDGFRKEETILRQCYREALTLAKEKDCQSIAFPLVAAGCFGFPAEKALEIAGAEIKKFLSGEDITVYLVVYDEVSYHLSKDKYPDVQSYIDRHYVDARQAKEPNRRSSRECYSASIDSAAPWAEESCAAPAAAPKKRVSAIHPEGKKAAKSEPVRKAASYASADLEAMLRRMDEGFTEMLFRKIDEKDMTDAQCYKKANIDRKLFSKIRNPSYRPSKPTVIALAIALELSLPETQDMLMKAGFALSHSNKFDVIIEYCITNQIYDILKINEILFTFDQNLLGNC